MRLWQQQLVDHHSDSGSALRQQWHPGRQLLRQQLQLLRVKRYMQREAASRQPLEVLIFIFNAMGTNVNPRTQTQISLHKPDDLHGKFF